LLLCANGYNTVREAIEDSAAMAVNMKARSDLSNATREVVESWKVTQAVAAKRLGVTQPRLNDLLRGRINRFSVDALMKLASQAGLAVRVELSAAPLNDRPPKLGAPSLAINQDRSAAAHAPRKQRRISSQKVKQETRRK
jgi:predicted XRE-type DNA-binding protein